MTVQHPELLEPSPHEGDEGNLIGRDPRNIEADAWLATDLSLDVGLTAIRRKCLDCCADSVAEVRKCANAFAPPVRFGRCGWEAIPPGSRRHAKYRTHNGNGSRFHQLCKKRIWHDKPNGTRLKRNAKARRMRHDECACNGWLLS